MRFELLIGPMFSSKSGELRRLCGRYRSIGKRVLLCKPAMDTRTSGVHARDHADDAPCVTVERLCDLLELEAFERADVLGVDEVQFFPDAAEFVRALERRGCDKAVIACGLSGDSDRQPWPAVSALVPLADDVQFLTALCAECERVTPAAFTRCLTDKAGQVAISGDACRYAAVCRRHAAGGPPGRGSAPSAPG